MYRSILHACMIVHRSVYITARTREVCGYDNKPAARMLGPKRSEPGKLIRLTQERVWARSECSYAFISSAIAWCIVPSMIDILAKDPSGLGHTGSSSGV